MPAKKESAPKAAAAQGIEFPGFDLTKITETAREFSEKAMKQNSETFDKVKKASEDFTGASEKSLEVARASAEELTSKIVANAKTNTEAATEFTQKLSGVKTVSEALEAQGEFFRAQFEALTAQAKEVQELAVANSEKTFAPVKEAFEKASA